MNIDEGKSELGNAELGAEFEPPSQADAPVIVPENTTEVGPASPTAPQVFDPNDLEDPEAGVGSSAMDAEPLGPESAPLKATDLEPGFHRLDPRNVTVERIAGMIFASIMSLAGIVAIVITFFAIEETWIWYLVAGGIAFLALWLWVLAIFWPGLEHKYASWKLNELGLQVRRGVLWRHRISVPRARVQHVDVSQGPLQRKFGVAKLTIYTAGTQNSSVEVDGLAHPVAMGARDNLIAKQGSGHVV